MKKLVLLMSLALMLLVTPAITTAADVTLKWDTVSGATGYKIQMSTDMGVTWLAAQDVTGGTTGTFLYRAVPDSGLLLFRVGAVTPNGTVYKYHAGAWYNGSWKPTEPIGLSAN